jgi:ABC-type transporter MlaC component
MRVAETRAVNRALRKAYGIGICSIEELGSQVLRSQSEQNVRKLPPQSVNGNGEPKLRDQLCLLIRQHQLDPSLVKQYAAEFCGTKDIRQASREQIQSFITHLAESATKDRDGLICKLNSYGQKPEAGAA